MTDRGFRPRALGEIAIRCQDLPTMAAFYGHVIGLDPMPGGYRDGVMFFRIGEGFAGHTTVLALFQAPHGAPTATGVASSLHHIALSLPVAEQEAAMAWYDRIGQPYRIEKFEWVGWRGVFCEDPEGNTVELVAYDASFAAADSDRMKAGLSGDDSSGA